MNPELRCALRQLDRGDGQVQQNHGRDRAERGGTTGTIKPAVAATVAYSRKGSRRRESRRRRAWAKRRPGSNWCDGIGASVFGSSGRMPEVVWALCSCALIPNWIGKSLSKSFRATTLLIRSASLASSERPEFTGKLEHPGIVPGWMASADIRMGDRTTRCD